MRLLAPEVRRGVLFESSYWIHRMLFPFTRPASLNVPVAHATEALVRAAHEAGRRILVWTVNDENDMKQCLEIGIDGIITDEPQRLQGQIKTFLALRP
jgi:glycerophosphoryl diester phosphodiesterase